jgi:DNA topoisomerase-1
MEQLTEVTEKISKLKISRIVNDPVKTAKAVDLIYVTDASPGIIRKKRGKVFCYYLDEKKIADKDELARIKKLVLPPAWENVWICTLHNGHLQATGFDVKKRKQYKYHPHWNSLRNHTKFYRMLQFGKLLPQIRLQLEKDLALPGLSLKKIMATIVSLMERTNIRVGNNIYEKLYGSFGLTTLKDNHVNVSGTELKFTFKGKKGIQHDISLKNKRLAKIVQHSKEIPGKELFQYYDETGNRQSIDSGMVNDYIRELSGADFTAKDFRTWAGTVHAFLAFKEAGIAETDTATKKNIVEALDKVASQLGNTRTVCKKYYVHPLIISLYESRSLQKYFDQLDDISVNDNKADLTQDEKIIMMILESN